MTKNRFEFGMAKRLELLVTSLMNKQIEGVLQKFFI